MPNRFTIKLDKQLKKIIRDGGLVKEVRRTFSKGKHTAIIKRTIIQDIIQGVSPVKGKGKFQRYSKSYKDVIRGKTTFRKINGRTVAFKGRDREYHRAANPSKRVSPVNLRHTGGLHNSFKVFTAGGFGSAYRLVFQFKNKLADIHNRRGAGKSKVIRRMLPTKTGETFNRRITSSIITELKNAVNLVVQRLS